MTPGIYLFPSGRTARFVGSTGDGLYTFTYLQGGKQMRASDRHKTKEAITLRDPLTLKKLVRVADV